MPKIKLETRKGPRDSRERPWKSALPFYLNDNGVLVHRVESVSTHYVHANPHRSVHYLCGNITVSDGVFLEEPPKGRLVCAACERAAARQKKPTADALVGRHVHTGRMVAQQVCCSHEKEKN